MSTPNIYYLVQRSSISPHHKDDNSGAHQWSQLHQTIPKGRLLPLDVGWCNLQCIHVLPVQMSLGMSQNNEGEGTGYSVSYAVVRHQRRGIYQLL